MPVENQKAVLVDTSHSTRSRLKPVALSDVTLTDTFWAPRQRINREVTLPSQYQHCEETGRIDNFRRAAGKKDVPFQGIYFNDSDVYKWLEAAAWALAADSAPQLEPMIEAAITAIEEAQQPNGYLNTYFMFDKAGERWTNLRDMHELYCAGHFIQGAIAHYRATGDDRLLTVACRLANHICETFGPQEEGKKRLTDGHEEIEMALVELARATGDTRYLQQAQFFIDVRGHGTIGGRAYYQDHKPFRDLDRMTGHAVRAVYLNAGAADLYAETGEPALRDALNRLWDNMTTRQMYISGGIGSRYEGEAFGKDYELPNQRAYTETCAAIGSVMWNWRMLMLDGEARYAEVMEMALYNGVLAGLSLDGQSYFYQNPLADDGTHRRQAWFGCACCPPNVARLLASLQGYFYSVADAEVWVHLYAQGTARLALPDGATIELEQRTRYPWDGEVELEVKEVTGTSDFTLHLRIPAWCESGAAIELNGQPTTYLLTPGHYTALHHQWQAGDKVRLSLPMPVRKIACHPYVAGNAGRIALMRGPLLYCMEQANNPNFDVRDIVLPIEANFSVEFRPDLLNGVTILKAPVGVKKLSQNWQGTLYRTASVVETTGGEPAIITAIPYYAWANREAGQMQVWLRTE